MSAFSEWNTFSPKVRREGNSAPALLYFLALIFVLFVGILIFCFIISKRASPVFLDSQGHPVSHVSHR
jgi:hypothetical protein